MLGAFVLDFYENRGVLSGGDIGIILIGFVVSFVAALIVVRTFVSFVAPPRLSCPSPGGGSSSAWSG